MPAQTASCLCGNIKIEFNDDNHKRILCHCLDCRKISGAHYSDNAIVNDNDFKLLQGTPKEYTVKADSGKDIASYFCGNCGVTVYRFGAWLPGHKIIKAGTVDDASWQGKNVPESAVWEQRKVEWLPELLPKSKGKTE